MVRKAKASWPASLLERITHMDEKLMAVKITVYEKEWDQYRDAANVQRMARTEWIRQVLGAKVEGRCCDGSTAEESEAEFQALEQAKR